MIAAGEHRPPLILDRQRTALLVIDMQNDFCEPGGYYQRVGRPAERIRQAREPIRRLLGAARVAGLLIVFTRLVYASTLPPVEERHRLLPPAWAGRERRLTPGSWGAEIVAELAPQPGEFVIDKGDYSAFYATSLEVILRRRQIQTLLLTGTVSYACVLHTAFDAFVRDFDVVLVKDGVSSWFDDLQQATFRIVELLLGRAVSSEEVLVALGSVPAVPGERGNG
ncbi:MAG: hypothetical protein KatS3mg061_0096 [Dehalococcoidia bacterium]|nr:MAG: hypothetical protein KatS3mg061_0096 [Dehalococcoidia bacterium]